MPESTTKCEVCGNEFQAKRSTARFCGGTCRKQAHRAAGRGASFSASPGGRVTRHTLPLDDAIANIFAQPMAQFRSRKRKDELAMTLLESMLASGVRSLLRKEVAQVRDSMQLKMDTEVAYQKDRAERYYEWLEESRELNRKLLDRIELLSERTRAGSALTASDWDALKEMTDAELRRSVMVGARMDKNPMASNPAEQAKRWVEGNRPVLADRSS